MNTIPEQLRFDDQGLIPAVLQNIEDGRILMVAYMNRESLDKTLESGEVHFWSRSRGELWHKGATSGNVMKAVAVRADCDGDCLLVQVRPEGPACHTGETTCFHNPLQISPSKGEALFEILGELAEIIRRRKEERPAGSYTTKLFDGGLDRIAKKLGEEAVEVVIAGKNQDRMELIRESADLMYHLLVLWEQSDLRFSDIATELARRRR
jgi:phosphoribosyl-ATP pyrophosphohydrolase/phosphoribosyl-AMP cyclohydrolase